MIDYSRETKLNVKSAVEKLTKDLVDNKWGVLSFIDVKKILAERLFENSPFMDLKPLFEPIA